MNFKKLQLIRMINYLFPLIIVDDSKIFYSVK